MEKNKEKQKREKQGRGYTAGTGTGSWCGGAIALCPLACVVDAVAAVAPQGCGSCVPDINAEEMAKEGFYLVKSVLRHR